MRFEIDDEQIQASAKKELEIAVSGLIKDTITGLERKAPGFSRGCRARNAKRSYVL